MTRVELRDVSYRYPLGDDDALRSISCAFEDGLVYGIIGPNGAGKTTLCDVVRGLIPHFHRGDLRGEVLLDGRSIEQWEPGEIAKFAGYIFQNPFTQMSGIRSTVFEEIGLGLENLGVSREDIIERVLEVVELVKIGHLVEKDPNALSGGQRQRVAVASILAMDAPLLVIDEPTSQLDPESSRAILETIRGLKEQGKSILLVEHKIDLLAEFADRILVIDDGRLTDAGSPAEVLARVVRQSDRIAVPVPTWLNHQLHDLPGAPREPWVTDRQAIADIRQRQKR